MPVTIDGTTGVSPVQNNTITSAKVVDASLVQADLALNVATTGPAFSVTQGATITLTANGNTKCVLNTEEYDTANCFDAVTNYRFQPLVAGYYQINALISAQTVNTGNCIIPYLYKNGSLSRIGTIAWAGPGAYPYTTGSWLLYMNGSTDYLELYVSLVGPTCLGAAGFAAMALQGFLARSA